MSRVEHTDADQRARRHRGLSNVSAAAGGGIAAHAFLWTRREGIRDLGTLPGDSTSHACSQNRSAPMSRQRFATLFSSTATGGPAPTGPPEELHGSHLGQGWVYVTVADPAAHYARAKAAGVEVLGEPHDVMEGTMRGYSARDLEGNLWSFGTRPGSTERAR
jgi:hypothetical protein